MTEQLKSLQSLPVSSHVQKFITDFPDLKYTGTVIYCCVCQYTLSGWSAYGCRRHIKSDRHKQNSKLKHPYWVFIFDLIFMLSACGVPQWVLENKRFRSFWNKYNSEYPVPVPSRQQLRSQFPHAKKRLENHIKNKVRDKQIWITVNETSDTRNNKVGNVLIRILNLNESSNSYVLASKRLENTNSEAIQQLVTNALNKFEIQTHNVLMLVSGGGASMHKAGEMLKTVYPNSLHITCLLHAFHVVAAKIRSCYPNVDKLISSTKMVFKSAQCIKKFHEVCLGIPEPPQLVTRWVTWMQAVFYYNKHFEKVKSVIFTFNPKDSYCIKESQQQFNNAKCKQDLLVIHKSYGVLADAIEKFQNSLPLSQSLEIVDEVNFALQKLKDNHGVCVAEKFQDELNKNPDIKKLHECNECLSNGSATDSQQYFAFANITSLDVERLFSKYMSTFTAKRNNLTEDIVETLFMMQVYAENHKQLFMDIT